MSWLAVECAPGLEWVPGLEPGPGRSGSGDGWSGMGVVGVRDPNFLSAGPGSPDTPAAAGTYNPYQYRSPSPPPSAVESVRDPHLRDRARAVWAAAARLAGAASFATHFARHAGLGWSMTDQRQQVLAVAFPQMTNAQFVLDGLARLVAHRDATARPPPPRRSLGRKPASCKTP